MSEFNPEIDLYSEKSDEDLVCMAGSDKSAVNALVMRYSKLVWIKSRIYAKTSADSDDYNQEGLMSLLKAVSTFDESRGVKFSTYAETCVNNSMRNLYAKISRSQTAESIEDSEADEEFTDDTNPETIYLNKEFFSELFHSMDKLLSATEKKVFELVIQGLSYKETAEMLGISEKSVDNAMLRARTKIRRHFPK